MKSMQLKNLKDIGQRVRAVVRFLLGRMSAHRLNQVAGSLSFTSVLSLVPLLVVMLAILTAFPVFDRFQKEIQQYMFDNLMPDKMSKVVMKQITQFAEQSSRLSMAGGVSLVFT